MTIVELLTKAKKLGASDLHLVVDSPPLLRVRGRLEPLNDTSQLSETELNLLFEQITTEEERCIFSKNLELDFAYHLKEAGFFRCNACMQRGVISLSIRLLPKRIPTIDELQLPQICKELALNKRGLVILTGPTGSGKSTTLAAMIQHMNQNDHRHIVTIEDPIEYEFQSAQCAINQRQLGSDTQSFANALRHVLRQDPDVIMVGEMRDHITAASVLSIAETGHLILTTGHAPSSPQAIERIIDLFPLHERLLVQSRLASLLVAVLCQTLVPLADGSGRIAAVEIMLGTPGVKNLIRDGKVHQLYNAIRTGYQAGMILMDDALVDLYNQRLITKEVLFEFCRDKEEMNKLLYKPVVKSKSQSISSNQATSNRQIKLS